MKKKYKLLKKVLGKRAAYYVAAFELEDDLIEWVRDKVRDKVDDIDLETAVNLIKCFGIKDEAIEYAVRRVCSIVGKIVIGDWYIDEK